MVINAIVVPIIIPLLTGLIFSIIQKPSILRRWLFVLSAITQLFFTITLLVKAHQHRVLLLPMGGWEAPFGITLTIDILSASLLVVTSIISLSCIIYSFSNELDQEHPLKLPLIQFMIAGVCLSFSTGDLFNLFVAFEIMLMASYALLVLELDKSNLKHAFPYLSLNIFGSTLFLCAGGLVYGLFGTLNFAQIAESVITYASDPRLLIIILLLLFVYGLKAGFFPLFYWLPNSYPSLPVGLGALFAGLLTKVGIYTILRIFSIFITPSLTLPFTIILVLSIPTMIVGITLAIKHRSIQSILSFNLISHIGFMMLGIGLSSSVSISGTIFYMLHHMIVISSLFLIAGRMIQITGTNDISKMGNLWKQSPGLGVLFLLQAFSLIGIPPFSGFWGKLMIILSGVNVMQLIPTFSLIIASILTLLSMIIIWFSAFYKTDSTIKLNLAPNKPTMTAISILVFVSVSMGLGANIMTRTSFLASDQLFDSAGYVESVFSFKNLKTGYKTNSTDPYDREAH